MPKKAKASRAAGRRVSEGFYLKFRSRWRHVLLIDERIRSNRTPNCGQLAAELEVSRRTVLRDIDFLKYDLGAPVEYDPERGGYVYTEPHWSLPNLRITEGELFALMVAEKALEAYAGTPWAEKMRLAFDRIAAALPDRIEVAPVDLLSRVSFDPAAPAIVEPQVLQTLSQALRDNRTVRMEYRRLGDSKPRSYTLDPYILRRARGAWYLAGRDHRSGHVPLFNLSRVRQVEPTQLTFDYDAVNFDPKKYFGQTFGVFQTSDVHHVILEFSGVAVQLVRERQWHASQKLKDLPGGRLRLEMDVSHVDDVWPWVLSWGSEARAVAPKELVELVARESRRMAAQYAGRRKAK
ncbi:transcriptional regulator [Candidatus Bathyarchaeota archaeon]|nr:transcriptional regulator [Candidatus Bathyarchaeota archaeon]